MAIVANTTLVILSLVMGVRLLNQYASRPTPHSLWYSLGLVLTAVAAYPELFRQFAGEVPTLLWWLYWCAASSTVGYLAVGTSYLISPRFGRAALITATILTAWVLAATVLTGGDGPPPGVAEPFAKAPTLPIKLPFMIENIAGSLVIFGGAAWSFVRNRGLYNVFIALGTLIFASGGVSSGLINYSNIFYFAQTAGILLLYAGVSMSTRGGAAKVASGA